MRNDAFCSAAGVGGKEEGGEKASGLFHFSLLSGESLLRFVRYRSFKPLPSPAETVRDFSPYRVT